LLKSFRAVPRSFLQGCGLSEVDIAGLRFFDRTLTADQIVDLAYEICELRLAKPIQTFPVFVSYSHIDSLFVDYLTARFQKEGVRHWRDQRDLVAGRLETQIDRAIRMNPVVVVVLSRHSVSSDWVEWEAARARELERSTGRDVLCPVALD